MAHSRSNIIYVSPWFWNGKVFESEDILNFVGFVYLIECEDGSKYVGRKIFHSAKRTQVKGKTKKTKVESDWKKYFGSSEEIKHKVLTLGKEKFKRTILCLCNSKSEMAYFEGKEIFARDCLLKDEYLNKWLTLRINGRNLKGIHNVASQDQIQLADHPAIG